MLIAFPVAALALTSGLAAWIRYREMNVRLPRERDAYRRTLSRLTHRYRFDTTDSKETRYAIGATQAGDRASSTITTRVTDNRTLLWKSLSFGVTGRIQLPSFDEVGFNWYPDVSGNTFLPLEPESGDLRGMIVFTPEIAIGAEVTWGYAYTWPVWDELRATGQDSCVVTIEAGVTAITVVFDFPSGVGGVSVTGPVDSQGVPVGHVSHDSPLTWRWQQTSPLPGQYELLVRMTL